MPSPKPVNVLRPRTATDLMDAAVGLYRHHFGVLLGTVAVVHAPLMAFQVLTSSGQAAMNNRWVGTQNVPGVEMFGYMAGLFAIIGLLGIASLFFAPLAAGAMVRGVSELYLGRPMTIAGAYRAARPWWMRLVGAQLLTQLITAGLAYVPIIAFVMIGAFVMTASPIAGGILMGVGVLAGLLLGLAAASVLSATAPAIVLENLNVVDAMKRSSRLVRPLLKHVLGTYCLLGLLMVAPMLAAYALGAYLQFRGGSPAGVSVMGSAMASALAATVMILIKPVMSVGLVALYYDLRVRQEGFDLEVMAAQLAGVAPPPAALAAAPAPLPVAPQPVVAPPDELPPAEWGEAKPPMPPAPPPPV
ncbi:MAG TPA: hypothetical protein VGM19_05455 [Armatimonadota bacterium]